MQTTAAIKTTPDGSGAFTASGASVASGTGGKISTNRNVAVVQADYLALANDLEQAQALTSDLEIQLSGKSNELARFKTIWEKTQADLTKFSADLDTMRKERHTLANEAQRGYAFELKLTKLQAAHTELTARAERLEAELVRERAAHEDTRAKLEGLRSQPAGSGSATGQDPQFRQALEVFRGELNRVLGNGASAPPVQNRVKPAAAPACIDIEFEG